MKLRNFLLPTLFTILFGAGLSAQQSYQQKKYPLEQRMDFNKDDITDQIQTGSIDIYVQRDNSQFNYLYILTGKGEGKQYTQIFSYHWWGARVEQLEKDENNKSCTISDVDGGEIRVQWDEEVKDFKFWSDAIIHNANFRLENQYQGDRPFYMRKSLQDTLKK